MLSVDPVLVSTARGGFRAHTASRAALSSSIATALP